MHNLKHSGPSHMQTHYKQHFQAMCVPISSVAFAGEAACSHCLHWHPLCIPVPSTGSKMCHRGHPCSGCQRLHVLPVLTNSLTVLGACTCWRLWIKLKNPRSKVLVSGEFGGWHLTLMCQPPLRPAATTSGSFGAICGRALSCWMKMSIFCLSDHLDLIAGKTLSTRKER